MQRLMKMEGVGPVTATAIVASVGDANVFRNGRQFAAWLGLTPRQHSSGGKQRLGAMTKHGDVYLRTLLIHGARAVLRVTHLRHDAKSRWAESRKVCAIGVPTTWLRSRSRPSTRALSGHYWRGDSTIAPRFDFDHPTRRLRSNIDVQIGETGARRA